MVSIATRSRSLVSIAPVRSATERLSCNSATICSSPSRWRQRVSHERSNGSSCRNTTSPQKLLEIRILPPSIAQRLVGEVVHMLGNEQPGHQPRRQRRLPGSHPTHRAEASRPKVPIDLPSNSNPPNDSAGKSLP